MHKLNNIPKTHFRIYSFCFYFIVVTKPPQHVLSQPIHKVSDNYLLQ